MRNGIIDTLITLRRSMVMIKGHTKCLSEHENLAIRSEHCTNQWYKRQPKHVAAIRQEFLFPLDTELLPTPPLNDKVQTALHSYLRDIWNNAKFATSVSRQKT